MTPSQVHPYDLLCPVQLVCSLKDVPRILIQPDSEQRSSPICIQTSTSMWTHHRRHLGSWETYYNFQVLGVGKYRRHHPSLPLLTCLIAEELFLSSIVQCFLEQVLLSFFKRWWYPWRQTSLQCEESHEISPSGVMLVKLFFWVRKFTKSIASCEKVAISLARKTSWRTY